MAKAEEHRTFKDWIYPLGSKIITKKKTKQKTGMTRSAIPGRQGIRTKNTVM